MSDGLDLQIDNYREEAAVTPESWRILELSVVAFVKVVASRHSGWCNLSMAQAWAATTRAGLIETPARRESLDTEVAHLCVLYGPLNCRST